MVFEMLEGLSMAQRGGVFISRGKNAVKVTVHTFRFGFNFFILFLVHLYAYFSVEKMHAKLLFIPSYIFRARPHFSVEKMHAKSLFIYDVYI